MTARQPVPDVVRHYDMFPYPLPNVSTQHDLNGAAGLRFLCRELALSTLPVAQLYDAGCGTGHRVIDVAKAFPDVHCLAIDPSAASIEIARRQAAQEQVSNIRFEVGSLHNFPLDKPADIVSATGVVHHLDDPASGVSSLATNLARTGVMSLWIFHSYGEYDRMLQRQLLATLYKDELADPQASLLAISELGLSVNPKRYGNSFGNVPPESTEPSRNADAFLSPVVHTFTFHQALELMKGAGLAWAAIEQINFRESGYFLDLGTSRRFPWLLNAASYLNGGRARERYEKLQHGDKLRVVELLTKPNGFTIYGGFKDSFALGSGRIRNNAVHFD